LNLSSRTEKNLGNNKPLKRERGVQGIDEPKDHIYELNEQTNVAKKRHCEQVNALDCLAQTYDSASESSDEDHTEVLASDSSSATPVTLFSDPFNISCAVASGTNNVNEKVERAETTDPWDYTMEDAARLARSVDTKKWYD
jgi:hypothetical protein